MKILELFCGTKSVSAVFEDHGWDTYTVDNNPIFEPTICDDIFTVHPKQIIQMCGGKPDVIWASPPCTTFSVASIGTHWTGGKGAYIPATKAAENAIQLVRYTLALIGCISPHYYFIENPRGVLRKINMMKSLTRHTVTYCQYGDTRMKPTDIWTDCDNWEPRPMCKNGEPCHEPAPRGAKTGTQGLSGAIERSRVPNQLAEEIYQAVMKALPPEQEGREE